MSEDERARALALLEATHKFPVEYAVSIISINQEIVISQVRAAVEHGLPAPLDDSKYVTVLSAGGKYSSHRFSVLCQSAEDVLALYQRIRGVKGVVSIL